MKYYLFALALILSSCANPPTVCKPGEYVSSIGPNGELTCVAVEPSSSPSPSPAAQPSPSAHQSLEVYDAIVEAAVGLSKCPRYEWKNRGLAPTDFVLGLAKTFARNACAKSPALGSTDKDALAWYNKAPTQVNTYTLLLGLAMRESSGKIYEGRDMSASNTASEKAEAGAWQTSWNSHSASPALVSLFNDYKAHPEKCLLKQFLGGKTPKMTQNWGSGDGLAFQKLEKECPAFAAEYAALGIRVLRKHWGPLNEKKAEFNSDCQKMFQTISDSINCSKI